MNRIEEIRLNLGVSMAEMESVSDDEWEDADPEDLPLLDPRLILPEMEYLLSEIDRLRHFERAATSVAELHPTEVEND